ncbi:glycosyltransferase [Adhaeribacter soli]|uniref:Glycosyltransferase n=1 Tax=Adhaeribacter soli TaxID=2607655 RepID=A0A5N1IM01_9BACT|nr:glycosyltransferase [Adhaeribacter soli]KAA9327388.1 glycosyltransferase [Adhaeribacter soli]
MERKPSVCFVLPSLTLGGAELQAVTQVHALKADGYDVSLAVLSNVIDNSLLEKFGLGKENVLILDQPDNTPSFKVILKSELFGYQVASFLKRKGVQVAIANLPLAHFILRVTKLIAPLLGLKFRLINYHHSLQYQANPVNTLGKKVFYKLNLLLSKRTDDTNIFISKACFQDINEFIPAVNPVIIHNSVPFNPTSADLAVQYLRDNEIKSNYLIVVPGRIHPSKGHKFFTDAFKTFLAQNKIEDPGQVRVVFAGGRLLEEEVRQYIVDQGLSSFIHVTGNIENPLLLSFLKVADLVVIPSIHEGFGNIVIEALMQQALVLASDAGGIPEIIRPDENGFMFKRLNAEELVSKLTQVYQGKLDVDRGMLLMDFQERFSFETHMSRLKEVIGG